MLELFRENAEERLETQKCLYEHEDENARVRHFLSVVATSDASDADRKRSVVAVAENEAACLRYRTEIDVSDRAARALADKARELVVVGGSPDESLESHASHAAAAGAEALLRGRDAESAAAEAEF